MLCDGLGLFRSSEILRVPKYVEAQLRRVQTGRRLVASQRSFEDGDEREVLARVTDEGVVEKLLPHPR